jgi:hypothetical protein
MSRMGHKPVSDFIKFQESGKSPSGKTRIWDVVNTIRPHDDCIGIVRWHGAWRKYVYSCSASYYDPDCLRLIADFCENATKEHYAKI